MADEPLSSRPKIDTTDFKSGIQTMNRELRVLESGFRASAAELGDWADTATGLEMRVKSLSAQMDIQKQKVEATRQEYERIKSEKGETSRAAQELEIKLNKETETLGKMQSELTNTESSLEEMKSSTDDAGNSVDEAGDKAEEAGDQFNGFGEILSGVGAGVKAALTVFAALIVAVAGLTTAIGGLVFSSADAAAELVDLSAKTGITTTQLQELSYVGDQVGTSLDTITGSQSRLIRSMANAADQADDYGQKVAEAGKNGKSLEGIELGDTAQAFQTLGVAVRDSNGQLRNQQQVFNEAIDALGRIQNPAQRDAIAMQLFGRSAQELNPLIKAGSAELARLAQEAHNVGAVMGEEDVAALEAFDDTLASLQAGLKGTLGTLATAFLPGFEAVFGQLGEYLKEFSNIVRGSNGDIGKIVQGVGDLIGRIVTDVAAQAPQILQVGLDLITNILTAITAALPTLLPAAVQILTTLINFIIQALPMLISAGVPLILTLVQAIIENLPLIINAALQAVLALANGLTQALPTLIPAVVQAIITIVQTLTDNLPLLVDAALQLILALAEGLVVALPILIAALPQIIDAILNALITAAPMIMEAGGQLIGLLATGIVAAIPVLVVAIGELIARLGNTLARWIQTLPELGKRFVQGLADGIRNGAGLLYDAVTSLVENMISTIMELLDINSPSRVGEDIGENFGGSIGIGGMKSLKQVSQMFGAATRQMALATAAGLQGPGSSSNVENNSFDIFGNVIIQGSTTPGSFGAGLKARRF